MSGLDNNRKRNKVVSFRMTADELHRFNARIKVCGMPKGEFIIESLLNQEVKVILGKYQSDKLSLELKKLREHLELITTQNEILIEECVLLMRELENIIRISEKNKIG